MLESRRIPPLGAPEITLRAPAAIPPIVLFAEASTEISVFVPRSTAVPAALVPIRFP